MVYTALLRGINIGGRNKVDMKQLSVALTAVGLGDVSTYINSGNIFFTNKDKTADQLAKFVNSVIKDTFNLDIKVLIRDYGNINKVVDELPDTWVNDKEQKSDVLFLWDEIADPSVLDRLKITSVDSVKYVEGAILWNLQRKDAPESGQQKLASSKEYKHMTIRNCNTARKLFEIMSNMNG